jgi:ElaB/YqjD/DUF883 family membrane-anchored ribosome-binding protein
MSATNSLKLLANEVEELVESLSDEDRPEIKAVRERLEEAILSIKSALTRQKSATSRLVQYAGSFDGYITEYPRLAFLTGALIGSLMGYVAGSGRTPTD